MRTIEDHVSAIFTKLGLRSRAEAAVYAASIETTQPLKAEALQLVFSQVELGDSNP